MSAYAQLLSLGLVWTSIHCAGMCGPILVGLDVGGVARGHGTPRGVLEVLGYQLGRGLTYAALGALGGLAGRGLGALFEGAGGVVALCLGGGLLTHELLQGSQLRDRLARREGNPPTALERRGRPAGVEGLVRRAREALGAAVRKVALDDSAGLSRLVALGALLGLMPCMITLWALGLAATTGSPLHGAGVMLTLVALTTPMLLGVTLLPRLVRRLMGPRGLAWLPRALTAISGGWLVMVGLAGLGAVPHAHLNLGGYTVMFW